MATQLTNTRIAKTTTPGRYFDGGSGLHLLVKTASKKYWVFRFTINGRRHDQGLGVFPRVSLADARKAAQEARVSLDGGVSPLKKKTAEKAAKADVVAKRVTFKDFALECVEAKRPEWRNQKHGDQWVFSLTEYAFPVIGNKALDEIETEDVLAVLAPIWTTCS